MSNISNRSSRTLSVVGFSVLATFFGVGVTWIVVMILASISKRLGDQIFAGSMPMLILFAGGALGLVAGLVVSIRAARSGSKTEQRIRKRYVGRGGRVQIYFGAPMFVIAACTPLLDLLSRRFGDRTAIYSYFGFILVVVLVSLFLYERIPARFIVPIGIIGWLLVVLGGIGVCLYMLRQPM